MATKNKTSTFTNVKILLPSSKLYKRKQKGDIKTMNKKIKKQTTTIKISRKLQNKLKELGKKGDTYEDIIWRLIK